MNHDLRELQSHMGPETRRVYEELHSHETEFGREADPEPPSERECRTKVCVCVCVCVCARAHAC